VALPCLIQVAAGAVNGTNTIFSVSVPYVAGTTQIFLNGHAKVSSFADGWTELGGNKIQMKVAPEVGDVVQVYFEPSH
jgi:hypothetical protein